MADHLTEEEQIEALKNWWKENWMLLVIPAFALVIGYFGYTQYQTHQSQKAIQGGDQFKALVTAIETAPGEGLDAEKAEQAKVLAGVLAKDYAGTLYADNANLILAKLAVQAEDLESAAGYLQSVVDTGSNSSMKQLGAARLARVKLALGEYDEATALVASGANSEYMSIYAEIRGDILARQGSVEAAQTAYQEAMDALAPQEFQRRSLLQIKHDGASVLSLEVAEDSAPASTESSEEEPSESAASESATAEPEPASAENS